MILNEEAISNFGTSEPKFQLHSSQIRIWISGYFKTYLLVWTDETLLKIYIKLGQKFCNNL